jgi:predicted ATPase/class 3 adenylate cyclase
MPEERKLVSLVFADVVGSTAWGAQHDPEFVRRSMTRYFERMKAIAETHGGTVEKFIGDAVMVVFGVPQLHEDDAERAVRAALAMQESVVDLNRDLGIALRLRIAVNSGEVVSGGSVEERQFLVTGDAVNVVARLEAGAEPGEVVAGELTERLTRDVIEYEPREPIIAKGKTGPVKAFRAIRARSAVPRSHGAAPAVLGSMVGRARELSTLLDSVDRASVERSSHLVTIVGPAGVGKSRLVAELTKILALRPSLRILRGRCLAYGAGITYWPLMDVVRQDAGIESSDDRGAALRKLDARLSVLLSEDRVSAVQTRISVLLGLQPAAVVLPNVPAERIAIELSLGIRQYLGAIAVHQTLVVVIDDLHWAESTVLDLVGQLADQLTSVPMLLVCVARPELLEKQPSWGASRSSSLLLQLESLGQLDTRTLLSELLATADLPPATAALIVERSGGNPLFCEEFVRMLIETGYLEHADERWHATRPIEELPLPESVQSVVAARLDGLPPLEKIALQRASVIGEHFDLDDLLVLDVGAAPEALVHKGFFVARPEDPSGRSLRFKHLLIRDVAYGSLSKSDRATLHDRVGARIEVDVPDRQEEFSEVIAYHAAQAYTLSCELRLEADILAPRTARAFRWSTVAGDRAFALHATEQAARHYALAIETGLREQSPTDSMARLYISRGRALELRGAFSEAIATYEALERLATERGDDRLRADALAHQATVYRIPTTSFNAERSDELLEAALTIARGRADLTLIAQLQRDKIHLLLARGQVAGAVAAGEESVAAAIAAASRDQLMFTSNDISCAYREARDFERARDAAIRATELATEIDDKPMGANSRWAWGMVEFVVGSYDVAARLWNDAIGIAESVDNFWGRSVNLGASASIRFERGDFGGAIRCWEESLSLAEVVGLTIPPALYRGDLGWCYRTAGAREQEAVQLEATRALVAAGPPSSDALNLGHLSRAATARGDLDRAAVYLADGEVALVAQTELFAFQHAQVGLAAVELKLAHRDYHGAAAESRARGHAQRGLMRPYVADFEYLEGEALRLSGALEAATQAFLQARATASALGSRRILWCVLASLATVEDALGHGDSAARDRDEARSIVTAIADSLRPLGLAQGFQARAEVRELMTAVAPSV